MDEAARTKHLELIQAVVSRLAHNSFVYKGWAVTIVSAIFVLATKDPNPLYLLIALVPTLAFWGLDSYYLRQERLFRKLYDRMRVKPLVEWQNDPFSMNTDPCKGEVKTWLQTCRSTTIWPLYLSLIGVILLAFTLAVVLRQC